MARMEAETRAQMDAGKQEAIDSAPRKVTKEKAKSEADIRALEADEAPLQQQREQEAARTHTEAERRATEATAAAMEGPTGSSSARHPREGPAWTSFEGSSNGTSPPGWASNWTRRTLGAAMTAAVPTVLAARARGRPLKGHSGPPRITPTTPPRLSTAAIGMDETAGITRSPQAARWDDPEPVAERATVPLRARWRGSSSSLPQQKEHPWPTPAEIRMLIGRKRTQTMTWDSVHKPPHSAAGMDPQEEGPRIADRLEDPQAEDHLEESREADHLENHQAEDPQA